MGSGERIRTFSGLTGTVTDMNVSADGKAAIAATSGGKIMIWRIDSASELIEWVRENRHLRELTCAERLASQYCDEELSEQ